MTKGSWITKVTIYFIITTLQRQNILARRFVLTSLQILIYSI